MIAVGAIKGGAVGSLMDGGDKVEFGPQSGGVFVAGSGSASLSTFDPAVDSAIESTFAPAVLPAEYGTERFESAGQSTESTAFCPALSSTFDPAVDSAIESTVAPDVLGQNGADSSQVALGLPLPLPPASVLLSIEGLIGAGKTTLLRSLNYELRRRKFSVVIIPEPVDEWLKPMDGEDPGGRSLLEAFYEEPCKFSFLFQLSALISRFQYVEDAFTGCSGRGDRVVFITERCLWSDKACFADMLAHEGKMSMLEFALYNRVHKILCDRSPRVTGMVHLQTSASVCFSQMAVRGREAERGVDLQYLEKLSGFQDECVAAACATGLPVLKIDSSSEVARVADWVERLPTAVDIFVVSVGGRTQAFSVSLAASVHVLRQHFWLLDGLEPADQVFMFGGKVIGDLPLLEYGVQPCSTLHLSFRLRGGGG